MLKRLLGCLNCQNGDVISLLEERDDSLDIMMEDILKPGRIMGSQTL